MAGSAGKDGAFRVAFPAVLGALAMLVLYGGSVFPTGLWGWTALAGLAPMAAVASLGVKSGLLCWGGVSVLAFLLLPDKLCALLFAALFGLYPVVKAVAERRRGATRWVVKLAFFNLALAVISALMGKLMMAALPALLEGKLWLVQITGNVVFVIYDAGLTKLIRFYLARVDRAVGRGGR